MTPDASLLDQLRAAHAQVVALIENPYERSRAEKILAGALGLVEADQRVWETTCSVHEERIDELEEALEPGGLNEAADAYLRELERDGRTDAISADDFRGMGWVGTDGVEAEG